MIVFLASTSADSSNSLEPPKVTKVMRQTILFVSVIAALTVPAMSQASPAVPTRAVELYRQLSTVGLDANQAYGIRDVSLNREDIHLVLTEGTIAFTAAVNGRITGAFFEGEGEILLVPPNQVERGTLALFNKSAVLTEKFTGAYLRFSDDLFQELQPELRPAENGPQFVQRWQGAARSLALGDALRLSAALLNEDGQDRFLHARLIGQQMGTLDVFFDTRAEEQIAVAHAGVAGNGARYYDLWTAFPMRSARQQERLDWRAYDPFQITSTRIRAHVEPPRELSAEAEVSLRLKRAGERMLLFELSRYLQVKAVTLAQESEQGEERVEFIQNEALEGSELSRRGNDLVAVVLPRAPAAGQQVRLRFVYAGPVLSDAGGGLMYVGARGIWYPNRGPAMGDFDLEFRYPNSWTLVATGKRVSEQPAGTEQVARWVSERPIPLAGFNLGRYVASITETSPQAGKVKIETYASRDVELALQPGPTPQPDSVILPGVAGRHERFPLGSVQTPLSLPSPARSIKSLAQRAAGTVDYLSGRLGPFPYSALALTQMPGSESQGWPGLVFLSSYAFLVESAPNKFDPLNRILFEHVVPAHEIAHQWWGDAVLWKGYRDQWLIEALANYCALMELEAANPASFGAVMEHYRLNQMRQADGKAPYREAGPVSLGVRLTSSKFPDGYEVVAYGRGTWLLHMLRSMFRDASTMPRIRTSRKPLEKTAGAEQKSGDELFFKTLYGLQRELQGGAIGTRDLQRAFEDVLPQNLRFEGSKSLDWFFESWVNGKAMPRLRLKEVTFARKPASSYVSGRLMQEDAPDTLITSVPIYASTAEGKLIPVARVFADGNETPFRFAVPAGTRKLVVDPYKTVLSQP